MLNNKKYPNIICNDNELIIDIGNWLGVKYNIKRELGKVLLKLGFSSNDEIVLCKYNKDKKIFTYIVNGCNPYKKNTICLDKGLVDNEALLIITTGSKNTFDRKVYKCLRCNNKLDGNFKMVLLDRVLSNKVSYRRIFDNNYDSIIVKYKDNYSISIIMDKPDCGLLSDYENVYDKNDMLRNGDRLVSYLVNLEYPYNIDSIYKDISKYLDVNFFSKFSLCIKKNNNDYIDDVINKISLDNGNISEYIITKDGIRIVVNRDGYWSYESKCNDNNYFIDGVNGKILWEKGIDEDNLKLYEELKHNAKKEVKRLVKKIYNDGGDGNDR